jgi:orotidine-5'-phosphate decarboxylase
MGVDPHAPLLRAWGLEDSAQGLETFCERALEAAVGHVAVVKPQAAFFERHGAPGVRVLTDFLARAKSAGLLTLLDAKRGDIGSTMEAYSEAIFESGFRAHAATFTPYLGVRSLQPAFTAAHRSSGAAIVVTQSSNPEGSELQRAVGAGGVSVQQQVVNGAVELAEEHELALGSIGFVVSPAGGRKVEVDLPTGCLILCPGVGAQGLAVEDAVTAFDAHLRPGLMVAASRSILEGGPDATSMQQRIKELQDAARGAA